jgi:hypothetical protein
MNDNRNKLVTVALIVWACLALVVGAGGWFRNSSALVVAITVWSLTALALLACWKIGPIRAWAMNVDLRWLVLFHGTRFLAGGYFLVLCWRHELPCAFATPAGWADIIVAVLAFALLGAMQVRFAKVLITVWNTIGFVDIVFVVVSALRFGLKDWQSMHALRELPLSLLPTFLVPLIIGSHILIFVRLAMRNKSQ